jgi:energy-coupling factor transporter ATP-binding protein EcfA2
LVTHHVELVLPGANYVVRMLDGRIDTQGTLAELRAQGVLDDIAHSEEVYVYEDGQDSGDSEDSEPGTPNAEEIAAEAIEGARPAKETKKPRKLVKDEERQEGGVKWSIYKTYLKASCV